MAGYEGEFVINLRRNNLNTPWGFRLHGGKEFDTFLSVQRVFSGSPADGHLQRGDFIVSVDNEDVTHWTQQQAQDFIQSIGLTLGLVIQRGSVPRAPSESRPAPSQAQPAPSFVGAVRKPFGQPYESQPLSPQMTSKATLKFQQSSPNVQYTSNDLENIGPSSAARPGTWAPPSQNSFSTSNQVRQAQGSYSQPQPNESYSGRDPWQDHHYHQQHQQQHQQQLSPTDARQDYGGFPHHQQQHQQQQQQQQQHQQQQHPYHESNHVHDRHDMRPSASSGYNEEVYDEGRREEGVARGGGGEGGGEGGEEEQEGEDYQVLSVRDIKQMFNKPDEESYKATPRTITPAKAPPTVTRPLEAIGSHHNYHGPGMIQPKQPTKSMVGAIRRGPPPDDDFSKPFSPPAPSRIGHHRFASLPVLAKPSAPVSLNKQGLAYAGIVQPSVPQKTTAAPGTKPQKGQKKKDFDPAQSAVYQILLEEEKRAKENPNQEPEEEESAPRRQQPAQGPRKQAPRQQGPRQQAPRQQAPRQQAQGGSSLTQLLERDQAQLAPYQEEPRASPRREHPSHGYQEPRGTPYQEPRAPTYQEPRAAAYQEPRGSPYQEPRGSPYQEPRGSPYQEPRGSPCQESRAIQPHQIEASHQYRSPPRGQGNRPIPSKQLPPAAATYSAYDYTPSFPQTQYVDGIPTSDF